MTRASVVLPVPGGPHRITELSRSASTNVRSGRPGPSRCGWPTMSSSVVGRSRSASGACLRSCSCSAASKRLLSLLGNVATVATAAPGGWPVAFSREAAEAADLRRLGGNLASDAATHQGVNRRCGLSRRAVEQPEAEQDDRRAEQLRTAVRFRRREAPGAPAPVPSCPGRARQLAPRCRFRARRSDRSQRSRCRHRW